jgi:hypothetical protein
LWISFQLGEVTQPADVRIIQIEAVGASWQPRVETLENATRWWRTR